MNATLSPSTKQQLKAIADPMASVRSNWSRYEYCKLRGHVRYCETAKRLEQYWAGGGLQWLEDDRHDMEVVQLAKAIEINEIFDAVNTAVGYQINNRLDISFRPRGEGANEEIAATLSKVAMEIADQTRLRWVETDVYRDGMIQQRGYYEIRMKFDENLKGDISICALDPLDVIPDPDAKSYDPDDWADVIITRWLTLDEVETMYGSKARRAIEARGFPVNERDFGVAANEVDRNKFGEEEWGAGSQFDAYYIEGGITRVRVIDRQFWMMKMSNCVVYKTGELRNVDQATPEQMAAYRAQGCITLKRMQKRVRWLVTTLDVELFNGWSPYEKFTVVPYFPYFRRGLTRGYVDNAIGPQDLLNKVTSKIAQIISSTVQAGYFIEEESLSNMTTEDLQANGGKPAIVIEYHKGSAKPERITPGQAPAAFFELAAMASGKIKLAMGNPDSLKGDRGKNQSGEAVKSQQWGDQITLATPLDNLSRTRHMLVERMLSYIQHFIDEPRILRIAHSDKVTGSKSTVELQVNWPQEDGQVLNDLTLGEYGVVITEQPAQITFENSQYNQALEMRKEGIAIPDPVVVRYSTLSDKAELMQQMQAGQQDPVKDAMVILNQAKAELAKAQGFNQKIQALFASIRTAQIVEAAPQTAGIADAIAHAVGFQDEGAPGGPIPAPAPGTPAAPMPPTNTDPLSTGNANLGADAGIKGGAIPPGA
jgi:hypothetical protein